MAYVILGSQRQMESVFLPSPDQFGLAHEAGGNRYGARLAKSAVFIVIDRGGRKIEEKRQRKEIFL